MTFNDCEVVRVARLTLIVNKPTTRLTSDANDFVNVLKAMQETKPVLTGYSLSHVSQRCDLVTAKEVVSLFKVVMILPQLPDSSLPKVGQQNTLCYLASDSHSTD